MAIQSAVDGATSVDVISVHPVLRNLIDRQPLKFVPHTLVATYGLLTVLAQRVHARSVQRPGVLTEY